MPRFQYIYWFLALLALPVFWGLFVYVRSWKKKTSALIGDERLVREITGDYSPRNFAIKFILFCIAFTVVVLAMANLRSPSGMEKVKRNGIDVMIALDVSKSMLARDISPNRLERARQLLGKLIDRLSNDRIGIVLFAGRAYLQMPLTGDHGAAKMYLSTAGTESVPTQGTVLADALQMCRSAFDTKEKKYKSVILISDGEDHDEGALKTAEKMAEEGIVINTIGMGSAEGSEIYDPGSNEPKKDEQGNVVITKLNEKELKDIAEKGNGLYQLFSNTEEVAGKLENSLSNMDHRAVTEDALVNYRYFFPFFLLLALILLLAEFIFPERKVTKQAFNGRPVKVMAIGMISVLFSPLNVLSQSSNELISKGNKAYEKKEFDKAVADYSDALKLKPGNAVGQYNLGNALYRNNKTDEAIRSFDQAASLAAGKEDKSRSYYNKGVVLQNNQKLPECIDAYKRALKLNPGDEDARHNLQLALQQQKQQQQKDQQDQQKKKKEDQQKQQQKPKEDEKKDQPKPQPSKMSQQDAAEKLKALMEQERNLQDKLRKLQEGSIAKPEKDW